MSAIRLLQKVLALLLFAMAVPLYAGDYVNWTLTNPRVTPDSPMANQPLRLRLTFDGCGGFEQPEVLVFGSSVVVKQNYNAICGVPSDGFDVSFAIGSFPNYCSV